MESCFSTMFSNLVYAFSRFYFLFITVIFEMINFFKTKSKIPATDERLLMISASEAVRKIAKREITSQQLVDAYIHRIEQVNDTINAVVVKLFAEATKKAQEIDKSIANMGDFELEELTNLKPLLGVPFTVKDSFRVEDQVVTCGVYSQKGVKCTYTAEVIKRMEAAGAILIAITNVPEAVYWIETSNGIYGRTKNPYDTRRSAGGSSGGEGALISSAGSVIGIGSDLGGSIRIPSFMNGIFGMLTTPGLISFEGHFLRIEGYHTKMVRIGPICRYVEDIPLLVKVMAGEKISELRLSDSVDLNKVKVYYMEGIKNAPTIQSLSCEMKSTLLKAVNHFESKFNVEAICLDLPLVSKALEILQASLDEEGVPKASEYLLSVEGDKGSLNGFAELPKLLTGKSVHTPGAITISILQSMKGMTSEEKEELRELRDRLIRQITEILGDDGILLFPSWPQTAPYHHQTVFTPWDMAYTGLLSTLAVPVIQCPMGLDRKGLPLGVQIIASPNYDRLLIAAANEISEAFGGWVPAWNRSF